MSLREELQEQIKLLQSDLQKAHEKMADQSSLMIGRMYVCMYMYVCAATEQFVADIHDYSSISTHTFTYAYLCTHTHTHIQMQHGQDDVTPIHVLIHTYIHILTYTCVYKCSTVKMAAVVTLRNLLLHWKRRTRSCLR